MNRSNLRARRGAITVAVLVCLLIGTMLAATTLRSALQGRREMRPLRQLRQTELLLDAGVLRAAESLRRDADYRGEIWQLPDALPRYGAAAVEIRVSDDGPPRQVDVVASITPDGDLSARTQRSYRFEY